MTWLELAAMFYVGSAVVGLLMLLVGIPYLLWIYRGKK